MDTNDRGQGKVLRNIGVLDLREATAESVAGISRVGNVGMVLHSPESAGLISRLNIGNLGASVEAPADARLLDGQVVITREFLENQAAPLNLVAAGQIVVRPDVSAEEIDKGLGQLVISGQLICPEHLMGKIQSKVRHFSGQTLSYDRAARVAIGMLVLDHNYLGALEDASGLAVIGDLKLPQVLSNEMLERKINKIQVIGGITWHEENAPTLLARTDSATGMVEVTTIPAGFELVERPLNLDADLLEALPARRLYCTRRVCIAREVDAQTLDGALDSLVATDLVICPAALKGVIYRKCDVLDTQIAFYEGELWLIEDESTLVSARFHQLEGKATLVVLGELTISADIDPKILGERLAKVHNLGTLRCTPEQMGIVQARLGLSEGELVDSTQPSPPEEEAEEGIGNVGYLKL